MKKNQNRKFRKTKDWDAKSLCSRYGLSPLAYLLRVMNDDGLPHQLRLDAARAAAPFAHNRLVAIESVDPPAQYGIALDKLDDHELMLLERIMAKAQVRIPATDPECDSR